MDPRDGLDLMEKSKFLLPPRQEFRPPVVQPVASHYTDLAIPIPVKEYREYFMWVILRPRQYLDCRLVESDGKIIRELKNVEGNCLGLFEVFDWSY
jgi:hypothetical protein